MLRENDIGNTILFHAIISVEEITQRTSNLKFKRDVYRARELVM